MIDLDKVVSRAIAEFSGTNDANDLEHIKARYLGKSGVLSEARKELAKLAPDERRDAGVRFNEAKNKIEAALAARREALAAAGLDSRLAEQSLDVTLPGRGLARGGLASRDTHASSASSSFFARSGSTWRTVPRSKPTSTISLRSISRRTIPRVRCTTRFI